MSYETPDAAPARAAVAPAPTDEVVNLDRYPLDDPERLKREVVPGIRASLQADGCAVIEGFIDPHRMDRMSGEVAALAPFGHRIDQTMTCYGGAPDPEYPEDHPLGRPLARQNAFVPADRIGEETLARRVYHDPRVKSFIAACLNVPEIHEFEDPYAGLVFNILKPGATHAWHFDSNDFAVSLMTREADGGGLFEYSPLIRSHDDERYEAVARVLDGGRDTVKSLDLKPGDLQLFHGRNSLHRVSPVEGDSDRHMVIFAYSTEKGQKGSSEKSRLLFGRDN